VDYYVDLGGVASQRFVDRIVDDFINQMVQPYFAGGADVHGWAQAHIAPCLRGQ